MLIERRLHAFDVLSLVLIVALEFDLNLRYFFVYANSKLSSSLHTLNKNESQCVTSLIDLFFSYVTTTRTV